LVVLVVVVVVGGGVCGVLTLTVALALQEEPEGLGQLGRLLLQHQSAIGNLSGRRNILKSIGIQ